MPPPLPGLGTVLNGTPKDLASFHPGITFKEYLSRRLQRQTESSYKDRVFYELRSMVY